MLKNVLAACAVATIVSGCGTTPVAMKYQPSATASKFAAPAGVVGAGRFVDDRGQGVKWLGAIRGGYGNPLKVLEANDTVAEMVQGAFVEGIKARTAPGATAKRYEVRGSVKRFECSQYVRREAHAAIEVVVVEIATGRERYKRTYTADVVDGSLLNLATGVFADVEDLRRVAEQTLGQVVDKALDDPGLHDALRS